VLGTWSLGCPAVILHGLAPLGRFETFDVPCETSFFWMLDAGVVREGPKKAAVTVTVTVTVTEMEEASGFEPTPTIF
jgi:hypothetical protein